MTELSKTEKLSFFNPNAVPLPLNSQALLDVYVNEVGELCLVNLNQQEQVVGSVAPLVPISVDEAVLSNGSLSLLMADGSTIPIGPVLFPDTYLVPELVGTGLRQTSGDFIPVTSDIPEVLIEELPQGLRVSAPALSSAKSIKRALVSMRRDRTGQAGGGLSDSTGMVANSWFNLPPLDYLEDPENIGVAIVGGKLVLPPGTYYCEMQYGSYRTGTSMVRLWSETHNNVAFQGISGFLHNSSECGVPTFLSSNYFRITEPTTFILQSRVTVLTSASALWGFQNSIMGQIKDIFKLTLWKEPDDTGDCYTVKRIREVTRRVTANVDGNITLAANSEIAGYPAFRVLDSDTLSDPLKWASVHGVPPSPAAPHWVSIAFSDGPKVVTRYVMTIPGTASSIYGPKDWLFQGRNLVTDEWVTLDTVADWTITVAGASAVRDLPAPVSYSQYRLLITGRNSGTTNGVQVSEFRLYEEY